MSQNTKLAIVGSGPAGFTAAIYAARAQLHPVLLAGLKSGGQLMYTSIVENFPGFKLGKNGPDLMIEMRQQAERFGAKIEDVWVTAVDFTRRPFGIWTNFPVGFNLMRFEYLAKDQLEQFRKEVKKTPPAYQAESVIVATGAVSIMLGVADEQRFLGRGVATCAVCDAAFFQEKKAAVVGGGDSAMEDALALTKFATKVWVIHRRGEFKASKIMQQRVLDNPKIEVLFDTQVIGLEGENKLEKIKLQNLKTNQEKTLVLGGLFYAVGHKPLTKVFINQLQLDDHGYVVTGQSPSKIGLQLAKKRLNDKGLLSYPSMTSEPGVFAAGDVVDVRYKQAVTSAGSGTGAALDAEKWLEEHQ